MKHFYRFLAYVVLISLVIIFLYFLFTVALPVMAAVAAVLAIVWGFQFGYDYLKDRFRPDNAAEKKTKVIDAQYTQK